MIYFAVGITITHFSVCMSCCVNLIESNKFACTWHDTPEKSSGITKYDSALFKVEKIISMK